MRIELKYRKVCDNCKGDGWLHNLSGEDEAKEDKFKGDKCENCTVGYTEETKVFVYNVTSNHFDQINGSYAIKNLLNPNLVRWDGERYQDKNWSELNPQSLHLIEENECPECKNYIYKEDYDCQNCTDGKISVETSFTVFQSQEDYDESVYRKRMSGGHEWADKYYKEDDRRESGRDRRVEDNGKYELNSEQENNK